MISTWENFRWRWSSEEGVMRVWPPVAEPAQMRSGVCERVIWGENEEVVEEVEVEGRGPPMEIIPPREVEGGREAGWENRGGFRQSDVDD
jgi:hypothetical protein